MVFTDVVRGEVRFHTDVIGDPVIVRADGHPAYNFAVVVDDALMEVTHVVRGEDHISNTPRQMLLYEALGFTPPAFAHLALVMGPDHSPLSKRHGATSVAEFRSKGYLPEALVNYLALIGWSPSGPGNNDELLPVDELARRFALEDVGHSAGVFDEEKLAWVNRHYLKLADPLRLAEPVAAVLQRRGRADDAGPDRPRVPGDGDGDGERVGRPAQSGAGAAGVSVRLRRRRGAAAIVRVRDEMRGDGARAVVTALADELAAAPRLDREGFRAVANRVKATTGLKGQGAFPSDPRRADRAAGRAGARSRRAGNRPRRGSPDVCRHPEDSRQPRARGRLRARAREQANREDTKNHEDTKKQCFVQTVLLRDLRGPSAFVFVASFRQHADLRHQPGDSRRCAPGARRRSWCRRVPTSA